jgi:hypothetical protein
MGSSTKQKLNKQYCVWRRKSPQVPKLRKDMGVINKMEYYWAQTQLGDTSLLWEFE